jgi:hypothetical protein
MNAVVVAVDGHELESVAATVFAETLPGQHSVKIQSMFITRLENDFGVRWVEISWAEKVLTFRADAGRVYQAKSHVKDTAPDEQSVVFWIEDTESGKVVAGTKPNQ